MAFRAWRPFNFNATWIGNERLWHALRAYDQARARHSQSPMAAGIRCGDAGSIRPNASQFPKKGGVKGLVVHQLKMKRRHVPPPLGLGGSTTLSVTDRRQSIVRPCRSDKPTGAGSKLRASTAGKPIPRPIPVSVRDSAGHLQPKQVRQVY
jgi:hypothetical protein